MSIRRAISLGWWCLVIGITNYSLLVTEANTLVDSIDLLDSWTKSTNLPSSLNWWSVTTSGNGQYKTAGSLAVTSTNTPGYFYLSNDSGQSWKQPSTSNNSSNNWSFYATVTDITGQYLLGAENPTGIYLSTNYGESFNKTNAPASQWYNLAMNTDMTISSNNISERVEGIFYATSLNDTIYRSLDSGYTWEALNVTGNRAADEAGFYSVSCDETGQFVMATTFFNADYNQGIGKIYYSHDYGMTWNQSSTVNAGYISITSSSSGQYVYSAAFTKGVYRSIDYGKTFTKVNTMSSSLNYFWITTDISGANVIVIVANGRLYYSNDYGTTWTASKDSTTSGNRNWKRIACNSNGTSIIGSIGYSGIVIGDIVTVYPSPEPTVYPTYVNTETPTAPPTYNVSYIYIGVRDDNSSAPIFSFIVMIIIICCCSLSVATYRIRYMCVYYWYRCTGRVPPAYYSDSLPHDDNIGYASAAVVSEHPQAEVEIVNNGTTASGRMRPGTNSGGVVTADAIVIEDGTGATLSANSVPVARGATEIPSAYPEPVPVITTGYAEVIDTYSVSANAPARSNRRTIGSSGNHPSMPTHSITGSHGHHRSRPRESRDESNQDYGRGQRRSRGGSSSAMTRTDDNRSLEV